MFIDSLSGPYVNSDAIVSFAVNPVAPISIMITTLNGESFVLQAGFETTTAAQEYLDNFIQTTFHQPKVETHYADS